MIRNGKAFHNLVQFANALPYAAVVAVILFQLIYISSLSNVFRSAAYKVGDVLYRRPRAAQPLVFINIPVSVGSHIINHMRHELKQECIEVSVRTDPKEQQRGFTRALTVRDAVDEVAAATSEGRELPCLFTDTKDGLNTDANTHLLEAVFHDGVPFQIIMGQLPFGYCMLARRGCRYATVLHEPGWHLYQHYHQLNIDHAEVLSAACRGRCGSFPQFVRLLANRTQGLEQLDNIQTRMLAGDGFWASLSQSQVCQHNLEACDMVPMGGVTQEMLERAKRNIQQHFVAVGVAEQLPKFTAVLDRALGHSSDLLGSSWQHHQLFDVMPRHKYDPNALDPETLRLMVQTQHYDLQLYEFVKAMVKEGRQQRWQ